MKWLSLLKLKLTSSNNFARKGSSDSLISPSKPSVPTFQSSLNELTATTMQPQAPKIQRIERVMQNSQRGIPYAQDFAFMDDGSRWEVPCIGNGMQWRKTNNSIQEHQKEFEQHLLATAAVTGDNKFDGNNSPSNTKSSSKARKGTQGGDFSGSPR